MSDDRPEEAGDGDDDAATNVLGEPLEPCGRDPETGFLRDGHCRHLRRDPGRHEVCAAVTDEFLRYSADRGNDLTTPRPELGFPGLKPGDRWCLCLPRWREARADGVAPPVVLAATNGAVLGEVSLATLREHAADPD